MKKTLLKAMQSIAFAPYFNPITASSLTTELSRLEPQDDLEAEADRAAAAIEDEYTKERLVALVKAGGQDAARTG